ncbi:uncharacterized protein PHALS_04296 [Plasmopara halstedii]|uniref:Uncharacterized protein n=1 Tax=Plasmopara halstedii TaxID=4781 RepID=A0A0P1AY99_PLAHL|nr:uncharacterized protein PHALS_04296 [Plasmopara halstedii]CEG47421.1 hypothetical protein PHALS_04296 [Plasmopara halstedii]|eukprot:XP_024583790.1 hypothetical protein PHALS_04296 [Plasmopara halstedii]
MEHSVDKETAKAKFRSSRLSWSNQAEHKLKQELSDIAIAKCRSVSEQFANSSPTTSNLRSTVNSARRKCRTTTIDNKSSTAQVNVKIP